MIVCLCRVASDVDIARAIGQGAHSLDQVGARCGAGKGCGGCHDYIRQMLHNAQASCPGAKCGECSGSSREAA